jgi:excisionase family DNA binding protein
MISIMTQDKLNIPDAAKYLRMSESSLRRKSQQNEIAHIKYCRRVYFSKEDLDDYIQKNTKQIAAI